MRGSRRPKLTTVCHARWPAADAAPVKPRVALNVPARPAGDASFLRSYGCRFGDDDEVFPLLFLRPSVLSKRQLATSDRSEPNSFLRSPKNEFIIVYAAFIQGY